MADRHTAQLRQIIGIVSQQSENTQFLLEELLKRKGEISELKADSAVVKTAQATMDSKLDRIINLLSGDK